MRTGTIRCDTDAGTPFEFFSGAVWPLLSVLLVCLATAGSHPQRTRLVRCGAGLADYCSKDRFDLQARLPHRHLLSLITSPNLSPRILMALLLVKYATLAKFCAHKLCSQGPGLKAACSFTGPKFFEAASISELALEQGRKPGCEACIGESNKVIRRRCNDIVS